MSKQPTKRSKSKQESDFSLDDQKNFPSRNSDKPAIGSMGGYVPDNPGESEQGKTATIITREVGPIPADEVLDETDRDYMEEYLERTL